MVLELKVPHENGLAGLRAIIPILLIYLLSFVSISIYWINHQHVIERIEAADPLVLYANLGFLFCLSLLPFFTAYVIEKDIDSLAVALYAASMCLSGFSFLLLRLALHRNLRLAGTLQKSDAQERSKHILSLALYLVAVPLAFLQAKLAMLILGLVTLVWIVPSLALSQKQGLEVRNE